MTHHVRHGIRVLACALSALLLLSGCGFGIGADEVAVVTPIATTAPLVPGPEPTPTPPLTFVTSPAPTAETDPTPEPTATTAPEPTAAPRVDVASSQGGQAAASGGAPAPAPSPTTRPTAVVDSALIANGAEIYQVTCARCHGSTGAGTHQGPIFYQMAERWDAASMTNELINGHAVTFGFGDTLTPDQIDAIVAYVLQL